ncbi:hypothetical protein H9L39_12707 [Fusarium oxysporum f. sp. albedinis]|nr:hypothetical protein H9L39_12707 [Fusarium oxysporum f. sp. albedinis]
MDKHTVSAKDQLAGCPTMRAHIWKSSDYLAKDRSQRHCDLEVSSVKKLAALMRDQHVKDSICLRSTANCQACIGDQ